MPVTGVRAANPIWYFVDHFGQGLNDQFYISFLTNTFPYLPQPVFEDVNLTIPWANPLIFFPNGTLPNNIFWPLDQVWRLEIRQGPTQSDPLIYEINNFSPTGTSGPIPPIPEGVFLQENQITNPQFSEILFSSFVTFTTAGTYNIAPGWNLVLTGTGTTTVSQVILSGSQGITDNPPYALRINSTGWTTVFLEQTFNNNGAIWAGGAVAGSILAKAEINSESITMNYVPSDGGTSQTIFTALFGIGNFAFEGGAIDILPFPSTNTDPSTVAFTKIQLVLPSTGIVDISNIQITGQSSPLTNPIDPADLPAFQQETEERYLDHKFHVYATSLIEQQKSNLLTGWIFGLNPWQFRTTALSNVANNTYTADQTIIVQQNYVTNGVGNNVAVAQGLNTINLPFIVKAVTATNKFAMIQYIDPATIAQYWSLKLSSFVRANHFSPTHNTIIKFKMRLISRFDFPPTISQTEPISSWTNVDGSDPVFAAGWTAIAPINDPEYTFDNNVQLGFAFDQFQLPVVDPTATAMTLGIVLYTTRNMNPAPISDGCVFYSISLVYNDFGIIASSETYDESLRKCQYYYESSYERFTIPGTVSGNGFSYQQQLAADNGGGNTAARPKSFQLSYRSVKRAHPVIQVYAPSTGAQNQVDIDLYNGGSLVAAGQAVFNINWTIGTTTSNAEATYIPASFTALLNPAVVATVPESFILFHYTLDSRLGI